MNHTNETNGHHATALNGNGRYATSSQQGKKRLLSLLRYPFCVFGALFSLIVALDWIYVVLLVGLISRRPYQSLPHPTEFEAFMIALALTSSLCFWHFRKPKNN